MKKWNNWSLEGVEKDRRKDFIIQCLTEYINEVEELKEQYKIYYPEIIDTAKLYKEIIRLLQTGGE